MESTKKRAVTRKDRRQAFHESPASVSKTRMSNTTGVFSPKRSVKSKDALGMREIGSPDLKAKDVGGKTAETKISHLQGQKRKMQEPKGRREDQENERACENSQSLKEGSAEKRQKVMRTETCSPRPCQNKKQLTSFGTPTRNQKGTHLRGNKAGKSISQERGVGTKSPAWMQHSPRPACCMSPIRKPGTPWRECQLRKLKEEQMAEKARRKQAPASTSTSVKPNTSHCVNSPSMSNEGEDGMLAKEGQPTSLGKSMKILNPSTAVKMPCQDSPIQTEGKIETMIVEDSQNCDKSVSHVITISPSRPKHASVVETNSEKNGKRNIEKTTSSPESASAYSPCVNINHSMELNLTDSDWEHYAALDDGSAVDG